MKTKKKYVYFNRELSWLKFNERVLSESENVSVPLLERVKFLAISASNLDEFCMVRIGGLKLMVRQGIRTRDVSGMLPEVQLRTAVAEMKKMMQRQYALYQTLAAELAGSGLRIAGSVRDVPVEAFAVLRREFFEKAVPVLTPVVPEDNNYRIKGQQLYSCVRLASDVEGEPDLFGVLPLGGIPRFFRVHTAAGDFFMPVELLAADAAGEIFKGRAVLECGTFRIVRNADIELREDLSPDLLSGMSDLLEDRLFTDVVRLELSGGTSGKMRDFLCRYLEVDKTDCSPCAGPPELRALMSIAFAEGYDHLRDVSWPPVNSVEIELKESVFAQIPADGIVLVHPYESFEPVVKFLEEAAADPDVLAVKQVLYRTASPRSRIVEALIAAARAGKHVTVLVELKARFDEARNISHARRLEQAGVHVIYGVQRLKTHAKVCLVVRREKTGIRRYAHFGTGNYNEKTAHLYADIGYFTSDPDLTADAADFFNAVSGLSNPGRMRRLAMSPFTLRSTLLECIHAETVRARTGEKTRIQMKMNALTDPEIIDALYEASIAGVKIHLNVRGVCCLVPGVKGMSENISVVSIVGRYLEHARIYSFHNGGYARVFISSADCMPRNLDKRVELLVPVQGGQPRRRIADVLKAAFKDTAKAHKLLSDGTYRRVVPGSRKESVESQQVLYAAAKESVRSEASRKPTLLTPYTPEDGKDD